MGEWSQPRSVKTLWWGETGIGGVVPVVITRPNFPLVCLRAWEQRRPDWLTDKLAPVPEWSRTTAALTRGRRPLPTECRRRAGAAGPAAERMRTTLKQSILLRRFRHASITRSTCSSRPAARLRRPRLNRARESSLRTYANTHSHTLQHSVLYRLAHGRDESHRDRGLGLETARSRPEFCGLGLEGSVLAVSRITINNLFAFIVIFIHRI